MALALLLSANASAATLARQYGAFGVVTYDSIPEPTAPAGILARQCGAVGIVTYDPLPVTETQTTLVPVPYAWLDTHVPGIAYECEAYEAAATAPAANGWKVWQCYALGLDPEDDSPTNDFRIVSIELVDGKPQVEWEPKVNRWTGAELNAVLKGAATLDDEFVPVTEQNKSSFRFFKVTVEVP